MHPQTPCQLSQRCSTTNQRSARRNCVGSCVTTYQLAAADGTAPLAETAATLGITRPTAKTHLEHIFLKTGVTRGAELMRLWTGLISPTTS
jgi:hypothetical protein